MLRIWGRLNSLNVQKVVWCAEELGISYERIDAGGTFGGVDTDDYHAMNPNRRIPVIDDDGFILWESNAVVRYLTAKHGAGLLWPNDLKIRADADRWMDWQTTTLSPSMHAAFWGLIRTPVDKRDDAAITASIKDTETKITILNTLLANRHFMTGNQFTMGDIPVACAVHRWLHLPINRPSMPHVHRWYEQLMTKVAAKTVLLTPIT